MLELVEEARREKSAARSVHAEVMKKANTKYKRTHARTHRHMHMHINTYPFPLPAFYYYDLSASFFLHSTRIDVCSINESEKHVSVPE